jgi:hypothetical protein
VDGDRHGRSLTRREFDAIIRRAAELAASDPDATEGALSEADLFRIAGEVGLPESHVRRALADVRAGRAEEGFLDRIFGHATVGASRVVAGKPDAIAAELDDFLVASQLLQPVRRGSSVLQYRPAVDWASQLARAASFTSRKYYIASAKSVEIHLEAVDERRTLVEIQVDPGTRNDDVASAVFGGGIAGGGLGTLGGWALSTLTPIGVAVAVGAVAGIGVWTGVTLLYGRTHKRKLREVSLEVEGVLDALETGESLEPPPASWRRWVKRHFHGVAQDLMRVDDRSDI